MPAAHNKRLAFLQIDICSLVDTFASTTHSHLSMGGALLDRLPYLGTRATCPNEHRHAFSIPLRCYMPMKIETLRGQSMKPSPKR